MFHKWSLNTPSIAGAMRRLPCTPQKTKRMRMRLELGLSSLNRHDSPSGSIRFLFAWDLVMRGFAIFFMMLARVASPNSFLAFFFIVHP